ncbi:trypco2 family protein [Labrys monachus]|uniref:Trypsin-co-occurring domain-containing protein n=1 Tax=Labrys monachus TaxID=217067 RepID=A0ABU0FA22_9HYPH|nr:trypco2 family protein [Labrys monachus]MDQ0391466.1 hypothetical protein [Labrys monachus]
MRVILWFLSCFAVMLLPFSAFAAGSVSDYPLSDLVREVKVALLKVAEASEAQQLPKLEKAELEINTSMKVEADGKVSLWVVELGASGNNEYASTINLTLIPPSPGTNSSIATVHLADILSEAILSGAHAIQAAGEGKPPLIASEFVASVHFAVERGADGRLEVKFPPFEASAGGAVASSQVQKITVTFKR